MSMVQEFKSFAVKGNADMAVGIIIGAAFGKIVSSLVNRCHHATSRVAHRRGGFQQHGGHLTVGSGWRPAVMLKYGVFINTILDFIIVALTIFLLLRGMNALRKNRQRPRCTASTEQGEKFCLEKSGIFSRQ